MLVAGGRLRQEGVEGVHHHGPRLILRVDIRKVGSGALDLQDRELSHLLESARRVGVGVKRVLDGEGARRRQDLSGQRRSPSLQLRG